MVRALDKADAMLTLSSTLYTIGRGAIYHFTVMKHWTRVQHSSFNRQKRLNRITVLISSMHAAAGVSQNTLFRDELRSMVSNNLTVAVNTV